MTSFKVMRDYGSKHKLLMWASIFVAVGIAMSVTVVPLTSFQQIFAAIGENKTDAIDDSESTGPSTPAIRL